MRASEVIKLAESQIGTKEVPAGSNKQKYGEAYGWNGVAWCVIFIWWLFNKLGASKLFFDGKKVASCSAVITWAKVNKKWYTSPKVGDLVLFQFKTGRHIGIVKSINGKTITTIEGNTSLTSDDNGGSVMQRTRSSYILGYVRPDYDPEGSRYTGQLPSKTLKRGSKGSQVILLQRFLDWYGDYGLKLDGSFGSLTLAAVKKYQAAEKLAVDGSFGPASRARAKTIIK